MSVSTVLPLQTKNKERMEVCMYHNFFFFFGQAMHLVGSQLSDQGLNTGHSSESVES